MGITEYYKTEIEPLNRQLKKSLGIEETYKSVDNVVHIKVQYIDSDTIVAQEQGICLNCGDPVEGRTISACFSCTDEMERHPDYE